MPRGSRAAFHGGRVAILGLVLAGLAAVPALAAGTPISVVVDRAKVMRISRPAAVVILGNPAIADATIQDSRTLIITGRSFGTTNLIVLDEAGQPIADEILTVQSSNDEVVTVYKRAARETFSCAPDCSPTLTIGDQPSVFSAVNSQIQAHSAMSEAASDK